jgi:heat-inducible transcriptional repressor
MRLDLPQADLDAAARYINDNFRGWTLEKVRHEIAHRLEKERSEYDKLMSSLEQLYRGGALHQEADQSSVYVEGVSNLIVKDADRERLREMLRLLEEKQRIVELLSSYVDTRQEAVRVVIGLEDQLPEMHNLVLIGAPARVGDEVVGSLAVIGPTRMDYEHTITAVSYIAQLFDKVLNDENQ